MSKTMKLWRFGAMAVVLVLSGCGEDKIRQGKEDPTSVVEPDSSPPEDTAEVEEETETETQSVQVVPIMDEVITQTQNNYCSKAFECCSESERQDNLGMSVESAQECKGKSFGQVFAGVLSQYTEAVEDGTVEYDEDAAAACREAMQSQSCSEFAATDGMFSDDLPGCSDMFVPQLEEGDECEKDIECKSGFCKRAVDNDGNFDRTDKSCAQPPKAGDPCPNGKCEGDGLYCNTSAGPLPEDWTCQQTGAVGNACVNDSQCQSGMCQQVDGSSQCVEASTSTLCDGN